MPDRESISEAFIRATSQWAEERRKPDGSLDPGILGTGLSVAELLRRYWPLDVRAVDTGSQVRGQGGPAVARILARYGETRKFLAEGGRTSRTSRPSGVVLGQVLTDVGTALGFPDLTVEDKVIVVDELQGWLTNLTRTEFYDRQRIEADLIDPTKPAKVAISAIMAAAVARGGTAAGAVAQHLVGAKLELRFPDDAIGRDSYTTADVQTSRAGDFQVGDTAFHVTMSPGQPLLEKCKRNVADGYRPVVIVPERFVATATGLAEVVGVPDRVEVLSVESFVGLNVEEMAGFHSHRVRSGLRALLEKYNERVEAVEANLSLLIEIPERL